MHFLPGVAEGMTCQSVKAFNQRHHLAHFTAVSPGVHQYAAAYGAGNTAREGQSGQTGQHGNGVGSRHHGTGLGMEKLAIHLNIAHAAGNANHNATDAAGLDQQVAAVTDDRHWHMKRLC